MEGHRLRVGAIAWSSSLLSSGSRDKSILQRDIRVQDDFVSKLTGHKSEVRLPSLFCLIEPLRSMNFQFYLMTSTFSLHAIVDCLFFLIDFY